MLLQFPGFLLLWFHKTHALRRHMRLLGRTHDLIILSANLVSNLVSLLFPFTTLISLYLQRSFVTAGHNIKSTGISTAQSSSTSFQHSIYTNYAKPWARISIVYSLWSDVWRQTSDLNLKGINPEISHVFPMNEICLLAFHIAFGRREMDWNLVSSSITITIVIPTITSNNSFIWRLKKDSLYM